MKYFVKYNSIIIFSLLFVLIEFLGTFLVEGIFFVRDFRYIISLLILFNTILFIIKSDKARFYTAISLLLTQGVLMFFFVIMFEMTGQHFDYSMFQLRNDAMGIIEEIPLDFVSSFFFFLSISLLYIFGRRLNNTISDKKIKEPFLIKQKIVVVSLLFIIGFSANILTANSILSNNKIDEYEAMLNGNSANKYRQYGITSNLINELYSGLLYNEKEQLANSQISSFIYESTNEKSQYNGVSKGNNVVTILGETLEWFAFINNQDVYPKGHSLTDDELRLLFPNFYELLDGSVVLENYYAREKTDVSEMYTMVGSYPKNTYINYDHTENTIPYSFANTLELVEDVTYKNSFHNGYYTFYNRNNIHKNIGFNEYYATEQLVDLFPEVYNNYGSTGERNLDSEMFEAAKDLMFTNEERFHTYALTITMHGKFGYRQNLDDLGYFDKLAEFDLDLYDDEIIPYSNEYNFISYLACALDVDAALGIMLDDLKAKNLLDTTTIVFFSDHYAYYQGLSTYMKDIISPSTSMRDETNYMELYRVPAMIYDKKLVEAIEDNNDTRFINKFTSSSDIIPTLYDILGINYYDNMYYGNNIFSKKESIVYSRSYDVFFNDKIYFKNINNIEFFNKDYFETDQQLQDYIELDLYPRTAQLVDKIKHMDQIYYFNYFGNESYYNTFVKGLKNINA